MVNGTDATGMALVPTPGITAWPRKVEDLRLGLGFGVRVAALDLGSGLGSSRLASGT